MRSLLCIALAAAIAGCSALGNTAITQSSNFVSVKAGETDKQAVFSKFGQPHDVFGQGSKKTWRYIQTKTSPEPVMFTLSVIIWPLVLLLQTEYDITQSDFLFDEEGKIVDVATRKGEKRMGLIGAVSISSVEQAAAGERVKTELSAQGFPFDEKQAKQGLSYLAL